MKTIFTKVHLHMRLFNLAINPLTHNYYTLFMVGESPYAFMPFNKSTYDQIEFRRLARNYKVQSLVRLCMIYRLNN